MQATRTEEDEGSCHGNGVGWFAAHGLRTPLHAISGAVQLLLEGEGGGLPRPALDLIAMIAAAARDLDERVLLLGEIAALDADERPAGPGACFALAELASDGFDPGEAALLSVSGDRQDILRAIGLVRRAARHDGPIALRLAGDRGGMVKFDLALSAVEVVRGEGAIAFELARQLVRRNGGRLALSPAPGVSLELLRAPA